MAPDSAGVERRVVFSLLMYSIYYNIIIACALSLYVDIILVIIILAYNRYYYITQVVVSYKFFSRKSHGKNNTVPLEVKIKSD